MRTLEAERAFPRARLGITHDGKRQLIFIAIPRSDQMDSLDVWRSSKGEGKLHGWSRHLVVGWTMLLVMVAVIVIRGRCKK